METEERDLKYVYQQWSIPEALTYYQILEESLKEVLKSCHEIIQLQTKGVFSYQIPIKSIENSAMGRLIEMFKVFFPDKELINLLKKVKNERDEIAHKGYIKFASGGVQKNLIQKEICKINNAVNKAQVVIAKLQSIKNELEIQVKNA